MRRLISYHIAGVSCFFKGRLLGKSILGKLFDDWWIAGLVHTPLSIGVYRGVMLFGGGCLSAGRIEVIRAVLPDGIQLRPARCVCVVCSRF